MDSYDVRSRQGTRRAVSSDGKGKTGHVLVADDGYSPTHFAKEVIFEVDFVCVVAKERRFSRALTLKQYLAEDHIGISILE